MFRKFAGLRKAVIRIGRVSFCQFGTAFTNPASNSIPENLKMNTEPFISGNLKAEIPSEFEGHRVNWEIYERCQVPLGSSVQDIITRHLSDVPMLEIERRMMQFGLKRSDKILDISRVYLFGLFLKKKFYVTSMNVKRKPVVTIMGHVDHGKTTLLDFYRNSNVAGFEHGGITQKIGGFSIRFPHGEVSFIDTPGHEIFTGMRRTGALAADLVVVIVSAVEGIQNQTREVLNFVMENKIPFIVAINKIDSINADISGVEQQLCDENVDLREAGGNVDCVHISARKGKNTDLLSELIVEMGNDLSLTSDNDPTGQPECMAIESRVFCLNGQKRATILVKNGILKKDQILTVNKSWFKVSNIWNSLGHEITEASSCDIVEIAGFKEMPESGSGLFGLKSVEEAHQWEKNWKTELDSFEMKKVLIDSFKFSVSSRKEKKKLYFSKNNLLERLKEEQRNLENKINETEGEKEQERLIAQKNDLAKILYQVEGKQAVNPIIIKTSDRGSLETIQEKFNQGCFPNVTLLTLENSDLTHMDITAAEELDATIYLYDLELSAEATELASQFKGHIISHNLIYRLFEDIGKIGTVKKVTAAHEPEPEIRLKSKSKSFSHQVIGRGVILKIFSVVMRRKESSVVGISVKEGEFKADHSYRVIRDGMVIKDGLKPTSIKQNKDTVESVGENQEGGISFHDIRDMKEGDTIECYK